MSFLVLPYFCLKIIPLNYSRFSILLWQKYLQRSQIILYHQCTKNSSTLPFSRHHDTGTHPLYQVTPLSPMDFSAGDVLRPSVRRVLNRQHALVHLSSIPYYCRGIYLILFCRNVRACRFSGEESSLHPFLCRGMTTVSANIERLQEQLNWFCSPFLDPFRMLDFLVDCHIRRGG